MESLDLAELNLKSAGLGRWVLKVHGMRKIQYEYAWQGKPQKSTKLECLLIATDGTYCQGEVRSLYSKTAGGLDPGAELERMMTKYCNGGIWAVSKVTLSKEKKQYIGAPHKVCIDLRKTKTDAILQGTVEVPQAPVLQEEWKTIVTLQGMQRVDITALISSLSEARSATTAYGPKKIVDVTIVVVPKKKHTRTKCLLHSVCFSMIQVRALRC